MEVVRKLEACLVCDGEGEHVLEIGGGGGGTCDRGNPLCEPCISMPQLQMNTCILLLPTYQIWPEDTVSLEYHLEIG